MAISIVGKSGKDKFPAPPADFFSVKMIDIDGKEVDFSQFKGKYKAILCVNVASQCGLTDRDYPQLVELHNKFRKEGFEILGFPCNQFAGQEAFSEADIKEMATKRYKVEFPLFSKVLVNGSDTCPLYQYLRTNSSLNDAKKGASQIQWNFGKFLLDKDCKVVKYYKPTVLPLEISDEIMKLIK